MTIDQRRAARAFVLAVWAGFFVWLFLSGELTRYLGPRTYWVVIFGAIVTAIACVAQLLTLGSDTPSRLSRREIAGLLAFLVPVAALLIVPAPELGALAASRKSAVGVSAAGVVPPPPGDLEEVSFQDIYFANESEQYAAATGIGEGLEVELTGFVSGSDGDSFELTRFYVSCCAADAVPYSVTVASDGSTEAFEEDTWLAITGTLESAGDRLVLVPARIEQVGEQKDPYLY